MSNYRETAARTVGVGGGLLAAADDVFSGDIFEALLEGTVFGALGYFTVHALGYLADWIGGGDEKSAKESANNETIYKKLTA